MVDLRLRLGNRGERIAERFLKKKGYRILERQFRTRFGEIDLIAKEGDEIIFVEVKTRSNVLFGYPEESVTEAKLSKIQRVAEFYLSSLASQPSYRIDVIAIEDQKGEGSIYHLKAVG